MDEPLTKFQKGAFDKCTHLSLLCPIQATILGYAPNLFSGIFFTTAFALCALSCLIITIHTHLRHRRQRHNPKWTSFGSAITAGLALETVGYAARIAMHYNPWSKTAFQIQICAIILSPTLICAGIYLTLKHIALSFGTMGTSASVSRWFHPRLFPVIFLPADLACLVVQAIGGGVAAAAGAEDRALLDAGNRAIIAGIALQVVVLAVFGGLGVDCWVRIKACMGRSAEEVDARALEIWRDGGFRKFGYAVLGAYIAVLIRCIYRIAEMAGGWGNHIMQDEISFLVLDPTMILITSYLLTIFHPGFWFPHQMDSDDTDSSVEVAEVPSDLEKVADGSASHVVEEKVTSDVKEEEKGEKKEDVDEKEQASS